MTVRLLDVNVLISLLDSAHVHHEIAVRWFRAAAAAEGWATTPATENGFIRIVSNVSYPNLRLSPAMAAESLGRFKAGFPGIHQFWPDDVSLTDRTLFDLATLPGSRQTSNVYLAGLAFRRGGRLTTLDTAIPWRSILGADAGLVERIAP
ncbi:MAG: VapC toxin family PIN domain ribonuclease [Acidobacteriota bacterium]|nr:VapC toxin family PIN domain ribonuclease [Acidobacteriota bacterium]